MRSTTIPQSKTNPPMYLAGSEVTNSPAYCSFYQRFYFFSTMRMILRYGINIFRMICWTISELFALAVLAVRILLVIDELVSNVHNVHFMMKDRIPVALLHLIQLLIVVYYLFVTGIAVHLVNKTIQLTYNILTRAENDSQPTTPALGDLHDLAEVCKHAHLKDAMKASPNTLTLPINTLEEEEYEYKKGCKDEECENWDWETCSETDSWYGLWDAPTPENAFQQDHEFEDKSKLEVESQVQDAHEP